MTQDVAIYCVSFPGHEPFKQQLYQQNIMCNAASITAQYRAKLKKKGYVFDDTGDNISDFNWTLGDLTATYWIWKNSTHEFIGTSQYRRFWDNSIKNMHLEKNTLYVQDPILFDKSLNLPYNLREQYIASHGEFGITVLDSLAKDNKIPLTTAMLEKAYAIKYIHSCNMFFAHRETYSNFCEILFAVIFAIHETYGEEIKKLEPYNRRSPAFIAERVVTAIVVNKEHFFTDLKVVPVKWEFRKRSSLFYRLFG